MNSYNDKMEVAASADDQQEISKQTSVSTTTTIPGLYGGCSAPIAIDVSSEDFGLLTASFFSQTQVNT